MRHAPLSPIIGMFLRARALVDENWCQGRSHDGRVCAVDALDKAGGYVQGTFSFLERALPTPWTSVVVYNDNIRTTKADILALYDRAIDLALKAEQ